MAVGTGLVARRDIAADLARPARETGLHRSRATHATGHWIVRSHHDDGDCDDDGGRKIEVLLREHGGGGREQESYPSTEQTDARFRLERLSRFPTAHAMFPKVRG